MIHLHWHFFLTLIQLFSHDYFLFTQSIYFQMVFTQFIYLFFLNDSHLTCDSPPHTIHFSSHADSFVFKCNSEKRMFVLFSYIYTIHFFSRELLLFFFTQFIISFLFTYRTRDIISHILFNHVTCWDSMAISGHSMLNCIFLKHVLHKLL